MGLRDLTKHIEAAAKKTMLVKKRICMMCNVHDLFL